MFDSTCLLCGAQPETAPWACSAQSNECGLARRRLTEWLDQKVGRRAASVRHQLSQPCCRSYACTSRRRERAYNGNFWDDSIRPMGDIQVSPTPPLSAVNQTPSHGAQAIHTALSYTCTRG